MLYVANSNSIFQRGMDPRPGRAGLWGAGDQPGCREEPGAGPPGPCHQHSEGDEKIALAYALLQGAQYPAVGSSFLDGGVSNFFRERYHLFYFNARSNSVLCSCLHTIVHL